MCVYMCVCIYIHICIYKSPEDGLRERERVDRVPRLLGDHRRGAALLTDTRAQPYPIHSRTCALHTYMRMRTAWACVGRLCVRACESACVCVHCMYARARGGGGGGAPATAPAGAAAGRRGTAAEDHC